MTILGLKARRADLLREMLRRHTQALTEYRLICDFKAPDGLIDYARLMHSVSIGIFDQQLRSLAEPPAADSELQQMADSIEQGQLRRTAA